MSFILEILNNIDILELVEVTAAVLLALTFHEFCHGLAALWMGDTTARDAGRLTLNPLRHIDPMGFICMVLLRFGWAKPVPVNMRRFKNPRAGMAIVAAAGPASNLLLGFVSVFLYYGILLIWGNGKIAGEIAQFMAIFASLNVGFSVFNIIPLPPLDGSRIVGLLLPEGWYYTLMRYERYIQIAMMLLLAMGFLTKPLTWMRAGVLGGMEDAVRWMLL